jgi:hypothetical protein
MWKIKHFFTQGSCRCKMAGTGIQSFAMLKFYRGMPTFVLRNAKGLRRSRGLWHSAENLWAEPFSLWHSAVKFYQGVGIPQYIGEWCLAFCSRYVWARNAKSLRRSRGLWHSAEIWARNLAKDWIPVPAILHRQLPCLLRQTFLTHDCPAVKPWHGKLFSPKLSTQGLIWNSISWHYTFKRAIFKGKNGFANLGQVCSCTWAFYQPLSRDTVPLHLS